MADLRTIALAAACAAGVTGAALALGVGMGASGATPASNSTLNVVGEPYGKAVAILRAQGVPATFGGAVGGDVPQSQCIVSSQKVLGTKMVLMLDCTLEAQPEGPGTTAVGNSPAGGGAQTGGRPTPGAPGVVTVIPTRVG